uniref:cadherin-5-like isoform X2 n=1 Tax=Pristiophorus japonicus TaxID=55135 RepID=UPI00398EE578
MFGAILPVLLMMDIVSCAAQSRPSTKGNSTVGQGDWIWNQLYCWEGDTKPKQIGKIQSMWHKEGQTKYDLRGEGVGTIFKVEPATGNIGVYRELDREKKDCYHLEGFVIDKKSLKQLGGSTNFSIQILDLNDNAPIFNQDPYNGTVPEMSSKGTTVLTVRAEDADDPTVGKHVNVTYKLLNNEQNFFIEQMTGVIRIKNSNLDREKQKNYQLMVQAKDMGLDPGGMSSTGTVYISLSDINDNAPFFPHRQYNYSASEATRIGAVIGRVKAEDLDEGENAKILYTIVSRINTFRIKTDQRTQQGMIILKEPLDFEQQPRLRIELEAENPSPVKGTRYKTKTVLVVQVLDVDEPPVFSLPHYTLSIAENLPIGTAVGKVSAMDPDRAKNRVGYSLRSGMDFFKIGTDDGIIYTRVELDREAIAMHNITAIASEVGKSNSTSDVLVVIKVLDKNDNAPTLAENYNPHVCEDDVAGTVIQVISAIDLDAMTPAVRFYFSIAQMDSNFSIKDNGILAVLIIHQKMQKKSTFAGLVKAPGEIREQLVRYDEEGGGEMDTNSFDITVLNSLRGKGPRPAKAADPAPVYAQVRKPNNDMGTVVRMKKDEADGDRDGLPYDTLHIYGFEGSDSVADSLSSLDVSSIDSDQDYDFLNDWGPRFQMLAELYGSEPHSDSLDF